MVAKATTTTIIVSERSQPTAHPGAGLTAGAAASIPPMAAALKLLEGTGIAPLATARIDVAQASVVRWPRLLRLLRMTPSRKQRWKDLDRYTTASSAVYRAIAEVTGARVVVDSSRLPFEPIGLG